MKGGGREGITAVILLSQRCSASSSSVVRRTMRLADAEPVRDFRRRQALHAHTFGLFSTQLLSNQATRVSVDGRQEISQGRLLS